MPLPARNLLATSASPYLLQHAANPVHWRPWGEDALAEARETGRPILLSIGYAACHWCHVMARESFEDPETAALMNRLFVNIKVDREERPEIDQIYMGALQAFGEPGGWPLTMFLRPNGEPFWGGTYFPPEPRWGRPSFRMILEEMVRVHRDEPEKVAGNGVAIRRRLETRYPSAGTLGPDFLDAVAERLLDHMDPADGGLKGAPKFPQPALLELLWRAERRRPDLASRTSVLRTLACMSRGGIWDHLGGGFARYSIDALWLVPHFEKMLYDNAQLLHLLGLAWSLTGDPLFRSRIEGIVDWLAREMTLPDGAFAASIDADSEHEEGRFYVWTLDEISEVLGSETEDFAHAYDVTATGNWEGRVILNRRRDASPVTPEREARLADARARLLARRAGRIRPATDDKCLTDWNGLAIHGLVSVARRLDRTDWLDRAIAAYRAVVLAMGEGDRLAHAGRDGHRVFPGLASDLAHMTRAALLLAETTGDSDFLRDALRWSGALEAHHADPAGGWFVTADDAAPLIVRPVSTHDDALPNPNAVIVENALRLSALTGDPSWRLRAEAALESFTGTMKADILSSASLSNALDSVLDLAEIVLVIPPGTDGRALRRVVFESIEPATVLFESESTASLAPDHPAFGKVADAGRPTAWVCRAGRCSLPVTAPAALRALIDRDSKHLDV